MIRFFFEWWSIFKSFFPSYGKFRSLGYKARIFNGDFILSKTFPRIRVDIYQGIEPYNPVLKKMIDFDTEDGCIAFEFFDQESDVDYLIDELRDEFDFSYKRMNGEKLFLFSQLRNMEPDDERAYIILNRLDQKLKSF